MYLKEAFQYQNFLSNMIKELQMYLGNSGCVTKTVQTHLRSKANPEAEDEVIDLSDNRIIQYSATQMVDLMLHMADEKERLSSAISVAKKSCAIDIDMEVANNKVRRDVVSTISGMTRRRSSERVTQASGYRFNAEGNQVPYVYDVKETTTIDFDRNKLKGICRCLVREADEVSNAIDKVMIETLVEYTPEFDKTSSLEDVLEEFVSEDEKEDANPVSEG